MLAVDEGGIPIVYRWYGLDDVPADWGGCVATIGVFDGVHRGHQRIIGRAVELARARNLPVVVITFDPHPDEVVRPGPHPPSLTSDRRLAQLLAALGADAQARDLLEAIVGVGRALSLSVIAEGVEDESQLLVLQEMGCESAQGFLLGKPSDARLILTQLVREAASPAVGAPTA